MKMFVLMKGESGARSLRLTPHSLVKYWTDFSKVRELI